jgi:rRNA processing protein Gar1
MEAPKKKVIQRMIVEDDSSGAELSDHEYGLKVMEIDQMMGSDDERKPNMSQPVSEPVLESLEQRLKRFNATPADLFDYANKLHVGNVYKWGTRMVLVKPETGLLNIGNVLYVKTNERMEILGTIEDVVGSIESPFYVIDKDFYLKTNNIEGMAEGPAVYANRDNLRLITEADIHAMRQEKGIDNEFGSQYAPDDDMVFSDDEAEAEYHRSKQQGRQSKGKRETMEALAEREMVECKYDRIPSIFMGNKKIKPF